MRKRDNYLASFSIFFIISLLLLITAKSDFSTAFSGFGERILAPVQQMVLSPIRLVAASGNTATSLEKENMSLKKEILTLKQKNKELESLQKQFKNTPVVTEKLVPAQIVGMRSFVPVVSPPQEILVNKGKKEGILQGMAVISEDHVVGKVVRVSDHVSQVYLITHAQSVVAANTLENNSLGLIKGEGKSNLLLQNVVLADKLGIGDTVITAGDIDQNGIGIPPGLILGKIVSVAKVPSALFQAAEVAVTIDVKTLSTVFIVLP